MKLNVSNVEAGDLVWVDAFFSALIGSSSVGGVALILQARISEKNFVHFKLLMSDGSIQETAFFPDETIECVNRPRT